MNLERCFLFVGVQYNSTSIQRLENFPGCDSSQVVRWRTLRQLAGLKSLRVVRVLCRSARGARYEASVKIHAVPSIIALLR